jgi:ATP phosphoribosyltransferase regulatory subunit
MTELERKALLPAGLRDILPPVAGFEANICETLAASFASHGYDRVKPPLVEFEDGLMSGAGAAVSGDTFRLMDPVSQRMMGVRADMTTQVARIALTRLNDMPRPLRLSYTGEVLRIRGTQLRPERQFAQVGAELIGVESAAADIEIIAIAVGSLREIGIPALSVDLTIPPLVSALIDELQLSDDVRLALRDALDRKDVSSVREHGGDHAEALCSLMDGTGPASDALSVLGGLSLSAAPAAELARLRIVAEGLATRIPDLDITIDPVENRGFEYHTGVGFTIFSRGERGEIGSGGRYVATLNGADAGNDNGEAATGFTLYVDTIMRVLPVPDLSARLFVPYGASGDDELAKLRDEGWVTVAGLDGDADAASEGRRLGCSHIWVSGAAQPLEQE